MEIQAPSAARASLAPAELEKRAADALAHLRGRLLGERDREDALDGHAVVDHRAHEALDQHGGLPLPAPARTSSEPSRRSTACALLGR